jgi:hypothetical protein
MRDKNQILIYTDAEISLIKAVFADNEDLLYALRKVFLQFPMTDTEMKLIKDAMTPEVITILKKRIYPEMTGDEPFGQLSDVYQVLNNDLASKDVSEMDPIFISTQLVVDYLAQQFETLKEIDSDSVTNKKLILLDDLKVLKEKSSFEQYVDTKARNFIIGHIDGKLQMIKTIAGEKTETTEQAKERMTRNSNK